MNDLAPTFVWYELMTPEPDAAKAFYREVVGWEARDLGGPHQGYSILEAGGRGVAGLMALPAEACEKGAGPAWLGYVGVADVDGAAGRIEAGGGRILRAPADIPEVGRFAVVADPGGAAFMLLTPLPRPDASAPPPRMTPGGIGWHELHAADGDAAFAFYREQFDWSEVSAMDMGPLGSYRLWAPKDAAEAIGGMMTKMADTPEPRWHYYFVVESVEAGAARIATAGGQVTNGPMAVPDGSWIVSAIDPQGAHFALVSAQP